MPEPRSTTDERQGAREGCVSASEDREAWAGSPDHDPAASRAPESAPPARASNFRFPPGFLWGAATSAHQVEGNNIHNDWWAWELAGRVAEPSGLACDHYNRYRSDFDLAQSLGHNAHRFSLEWSRIEPQEGRWSDAA